ncbi:hypothetical protein GCM10028801_00240 [Nocardioides maradonensis]
MNSSGIKRGLAASAVATLTVTGIGMAGPAFADSIKTQAGANSVQLITPAASEVSTANDGVNTTVHLVAEAGAGISQVQFVYNDGSDHNIGATVTANPDGYYSAEWTVPVALNNTSVKFKAVGLDGLGNVIATTALGTATTVKPGGNAVNLAATPASVGVYHTPGGNDYGVVSGTTNDGSASPSIDLDVVGGGATTHPDVVGDVSGTTRTFAGAADFTGYSWDSSANPTNDAIVTATDGSDDATVVHLYKQTIGTGTTAVAASTNVKDGDTTSVTVTVLDQNGKPVAGASVVSPSVFAFPFVFYPGGTATTNSKGQVTFANVPGTPAGQAYDFFVDDNGDGSYNAGTEIKRSVTIKSYTASATTVTIGSADKGYDRDELAGNEFSATVKDQNGNPFAGDLSYRWTTTGFGGGATTVEPTGQLTPNAQGKVTVPAPAGNGVSKLEVWADLDGNPGPSGNDVQATPLTVSIGQAQVKWNDGARVSVNAGTTHTFKGSLQLPDGTTLGGRSFTASFSPNGDAVVAAQGAQPSGTSRVDNTHVNVTTAADGSFGVAINDQTLTSADYGDVLTAGSGDYAPGVSLRTDFMDTAVAHVYSYGNPFGENIGGNSSATPGIPQRLENIRVTNAAGQSLVGVPVTLSVDHGYFTPDTNDGPGTDLSQLTPAAPAAEGGVIGDWKSSGSSITVTTGEHGNVGHNYAIAIGHDDAFAAGNGQLTTKLSITAAGHTPATTPTISWDASNPLNPGALSLAFASDNDSTILPKASTALDVNLVPTATDQFGNDTGRSVDLTSSGVGSVQPSATDEFGVSSGAAGDQTIHGSVTVDVTKWGADADAVTAGYQPSVAPTGSQALTADAPTINWYTVDLAHSTYTLTHNTANTVTPGTTVTETFKAIDQFGQPLAGYAVDFLRTGPDTLQNGNGSGSGTTNAKGVATYIFQGTKAGSAVITGIMHDSWFGDPVVAESQLNDTVTFANAAPAPIAISAKLTGKNTATGNDKLTIAASSSKAAGATATIYKVVAGKMIKVGTVKLGATGKASKTITDKKKAAKTTYVVKIAKTAATKAATSNKITLK